MVMRRRFFNNNIKNFDINDYLTIEALEDNLQVYFPYGDLMYGIDGLGWQKLIAGVYSPAINKGQTISFKGSVSSNKVNRKSFTITKKCNLLGNCMSLTSSDIPHFYMLFSGCAIVYISKDFLPATTLDESCYERMFYGCTNLVNAPVLPATTLADYCYECMFGGCTSLTVAPELPATTLVDNCYRYMFGGCTRLTTAPELSATTLTSSCYKNMFSGCTSLTTAPELPATTLAYGCYSYMFQDCTSLVNAPELPATTLANDCYQSMFSGCNSLTTAPELPATTLAGNCYDFMFYGCTGLTSAPELPATTLAGNCYDFMFYGCTGLTVAPDLPATTLAYGCYSYMFYNCRSLNYIKMLATDISATDCLSNWVNGVASTGTFVKNPDMNSLPTGVSGIPSGWTVVNDGEESGEVFGEPFSFYIADNIFNPNYIEYTALEGMTWENWVNSEYNIDNFICSSDFDKLIKNIDGFTVVCEGPSVSPEDIISANTNYDLMP